MHIRDLDLTQIRLLAELARLGSVSAASRQIGLSQSAASHALAKLRQQLGDPLFTRTSDGFKPTPYGERLGRAASDALDRLAEGLASNRAFDPKTSTRVFALYISEVGQIILLPGLLGLMRREAPGVALRAAPIPVENPAALLFSGQVDLAVGHFINLTTGFHQTPLFRDRYVCIVRSDHPDFRDGMTLQAFKEVGHAIVDSTGMAYDVVDRNFEKHQVRRRGVLHVSGFHVLPPIIACSDLMAIIPSRLAEAAACHVPIQIFDPPIPMPPIDISLFWHERYHHDPANRWMRRNFVALYHAGVESRRGNGPVRA